MTHWLINKNLVIYFEVRRLFGKKWPLRLATLIDRAIKKIFTLETLKGGKP